MDVKTEQTEKLVEEAVNGDPEPVKEENKLLGRIMK